MRIIEEPMPGLKLIEPTVFQDDRGYFYETFNSSTYHAKGIDVNFVQGNESLSQKNVVRGLHFQAPPYGQAKLVRVLQGAVVDVVVDLRKGSPTFKQTYKAKLSGENKHQLYVPVGFGHGFVTLEDETIFSYKCSNLYNKASEGGVIWNDSELNIDWEVDSPILSEKDERLPLLKNIESPFIYEKQ